MASRVHSNSMASPRLDPGISGSVGEVAERLLENADELGAPFLSEYKRCEPGSSFFLGWILRAPRAHGGYGRVERQEELLNVTR